MIFKEKRIKQFVRLKFLQKSYSVFGFLNLGLRKKEEKLSEGNLGSAKEVE